MPKTVLVPVDGSSFAEHALPYALGIAHRTGATLHLALVHIVSDRMSPSYPYAEAVAAREAEQRDRDAAYMEELAARLRSAGVTVQPALLRGNVGAELARYIADARIDGVVMTTHGRGGMERAWLGSTADSLIRHSAVPLLLIRPGEETREAGTEIHGGFHRILAGLDGSETAEIALRDALELGLADDATLTLAHIIQPPVAASSPYLPHTIQLTHDEIAAREAFMTRYLEDIEREAWIGSRTTQTVVRVDYNPAPGLLDLARELEADLVVLGTHGRGGLRRMLLGSVADKVIRASDRPVLVHRGLGRVTRLATRVTGHETSQPAGVRVVE